MKLVRTLQSFINEKYRTIKTKMGVNLVETAKQANPHGFDSIPHENVVAILANTSSKEEPVILGYLYQNAIENLEIGESIQYSTDKNGNIKASIILRSDGTAEILGKGDYLVRYSILKEEYDKTKAVLDAILSTLQVPINEPGNGSPSAFQAAMINAVGSKQTGDISNSKIEELKTK